MISHQSLLRGQAAACCLWSSLELAALEQCSASRAGGLGSNLLDLRRLFYQQQFVGVRREPSRPSYNHLATWCLASVIC